MQLFQIILIIPSILILLLDRLTAVGHAVWLLYYVVIIVSSNIANQKWMIIHSSIITIFIVLGLYISEGDQYLVTLAFENRLANIVILWLLTYSLYRSKSLTLSLQNRTQELTNANRDLESFNFSVSHDLKNPLIVISGFTQFLMDSAPNKLDNLEKNALTHIQSESKRMNEIIVDLLRLSRIVHQKVEYGHVNLTDIAAESAEDLKQQSVLKRTQIIIQPDIEGYGDSGLLRILFDNLIGNSIKFTSTVDNPSVEFGKCTQTGEQIYFICDNGVGFDMSKAEKIFEPFTRLHTLKEFPGTGIGLSIVRKIIEKHNGKIWAKSEIGKGTTIFFTLSSSKIKKHN